MSLFPFGTVGANPPSTDMSTREKMARILTIPFFVAGICWFWIHRAFIKGKEWEAEEMKHLK